MYRHDCYKFADVNNEYEIICLEIRSLHKISWFHSLTLYLVIKFVNYNCFDNLD